MYNISPFDQSCNLLQKIIKIYEIVFCSGDNLSQMQRSRRIYLWSFFLPLGLMILIYVSIGALPFVGPTSVLTLDMSAQYVYFFSNLRNIILGENSIIYSWSRALGGEFIGMYAYYLGSPLSLIVVLFPAFCITDAIWIMMVIKIGLCGLTMSIFLNSVHPTKIINIVLFSTLYALSAFNIMYMSNIMWIDSVILLPLIALGIERLISARRYVLFTLTLAVALLTNYYIGFMVCIFVALYFVYFHIARGRIAATYSKNEHFFFVKSFLRIAVFSIIAIAISTVILFPAYYSLQFGKLNYNSQSYNLGTNNNLLDIISKLFFGHIDTVRPTGKPFIYCGIITLLNIPLYFISDKFKLREKLGALFVLTVFFLSFSLHFVDLLWYAGHMPNWLNFRYSFIFIFFEIIFAYRSFNYIRQINFKLILIVGLILVLILILIWFQHYGNQYDYTRFYKFDYNYLLVYGSIVIICLMIVLLRFERKSFLRGKRMGSICLVMFIVFEAYTSGVLHNMALAMDVGYSTRDSYVDFIYSIQPSINYVYEYDEDFYRMEKNFFRSANDNMALNMRGISGSTSTLNSKTLTFLKNMGYDSTNFISFYQNGNPVNDSILGIRYVISDNSHIVSEFYDLIYEDEDNKRFVYKNPYSLSIAFAVHKDILNMEFITCKTSTEYLNSLLSSMVGSPTIVFSPISGVWTEEDVMFKISDIEYAEKKSTYIVYGNGNYVYTYVPDDLCSQIEIFVNGNKVDSPIAGVTPLGQFKSEERYEIVYRVENNTLNFGENNSLLFSFDYDVFQTAFDHLSKNQMIIDTDFSEKRISGKVTITEDSPVLFTSIPYDPNWKIYVDGEFVQPYTFDLTETITEIDLWTNEISTREVTRNAPLLDALIALELTPGEHEIVFKYQSNELRIGAVVSLVGSAVFIGVISKDFLKKRRIINKNDKED